MAKVLKLEILGENVAAFDKVVVRVVTQTSRGLHFGGNSGYDTRKFTASNGVVLASNLRPSRDEADKKTFWVRGNNTAKDNDSFIVKRTELAALKAAVSEYNAFYTDSAIHARQRAAYVTTPVAAPAPRPATCVTVIG